jgi:hypothetical protein
MDPDAFFESSGKIVEYGATKWHAAAAFTPAASFEPGGLANSLITGDSLLGSKTDYVISWITIMRPTTVTALADEKRIIKAIGDSRTMTDSVFADLHAGNDSTSVAETTGPIAGVGGTATHGVEHFCESMSDARLWLRRFSIVETISGTLNDAGELIAARTINELFSKHPAVQFYAAYFRYLRGKIRIRVMLNCKSPTSVKARVSADSYDVSSPTDAILTGQATKYAGGVVPTMTMGIPYLSTLHCLYTPWAVPTGGSSYSPSITFAFNGPAKSLVRMDVLVSVDDEFRMAGFTGIPSVRTFPGAPNFLMRNAPSEEQRAKRSQYSKLVASWDTTLGRQIKYVAPNAYLHSAEEKENPAETAEEEEMTRHGVAMVSLDPTEEVDRPVAPLGSIARSHMGEENWTVPQLLDRTGYVGSFEWSVGDSPDTVLWIEQVPLGLAKSDISNLPARNFRFFRFSKIHVEFQLNASPMHSGNLAVVYQPGITAADLSARYASADYVTSMRSHIMLNPAWSTRGKITIPFEHPLGYLHMGTDSVSGDEDFTRFLGHIRVMVYNPLRVGTSGKTTANVQIWAAVEGLEAYVPQARKLL